MCLGVLYVCQTKLQNKGEKVMEYQFLGRGVGKGGGLCIESGLEKRREYIYVFIYTDRGINR